MLASTVFGLIRISAATSRFVWPLAASSATLRSEGVSSAPSSPRRRPRREISDPQRLAVFTWLRYDGANLRVQARSRSAAGALRPFTVLSDPDATGFPARVGIDDDGDATVAWVRADGNNYRVQASAGP